MPEPSADRDDCLVPVVVTATVTGVAAVMAVEMLPVVIVGAVLIGVVWGGRNESAMKAINPPTAPVTSAPSKSRTTVTGVNLTRVLVLCPLLSSVFAFIF